MPSPNDPIDITKPAVQILMDQFNVLNNTNLNYSDFIFSLPVSDSIPLTDVNTKVTLTPVVTSGYYASREFFYTRIDVSELFNNNSVEITFTVADLMLSDIIDQINEKYGIYLTDDDYIDVPLPTFASLNTEPNPTIIVNIIPESYIYVGTGGLVLGARVRPIDDANYVRNILVVTDSEEPLVFENNVQLLNTDFNKATYFKIFRNTVSVDKFRVDKIIPLQNRQFYLKGEFEFEAAIGLTPLQAYVVKDVIIDTNGAIVVVGNTALFGNGVHEHFGINTNIANVYLADTENLVTPASATRLYKYNLLGVLDNTFAPAIGYNPVMVRIDNAGKIYTVSDQFTGPIPSDSGITAKQIRIDRLNSNGTIDNTFTSINIRSTGIADVTPILDIVLLPGGGGFVCVKPIHGLATTGNYPIVNDTPFVTGVDPFDCAFNPIFRFNQSGGLVLAFSSILPNNKPQTVMIDTVDLVEDDSILSFADNKLVVITNRNNPITGFTNRSAMAMSPSGIIQNIAPDRFISDIRWVDINSFNKFATGRFILSGLGKKKQIGGGWGNSEHLMASYNQSGQLTGIVYQPVVNGVPAPQIYNVEILEWLDN